MGKRLTIEKQLLVAERIINVFENILKKYNIEIPNDEKNDPDNDPNSEVSNIYGTDYGDTEAQILDILKDEDLISKTNQVHKKSKIKNCKYCDGSGMVQIGPNIRGVKICPNCHGKGKLYDER